MFQLRLILQHWISNCVNFVDGVNTALVTISMGLGVGGVSLLSTIIVVPIVVGMEASALTCSLLRLIGKYVSWRLAIKAMNHDQIQYLLKVTYLAY